MLKSILGALGIGKKEEDKVEEAKPSAASEAAGKRVVADITKYKMPKAGPNQMDMMDVETMLDDMAKADPQELNWRVSIVDLMKLLGIDSSYQARKELADELHCPSELMEDSAKMNVWLHKQVMQAVAKNGGKVPANLLD